MSNYPSNSSQGRPEAERDPQSPGPGEQYGQSQDYAQPQPQYGQSPQYGQYDRQPEPYGQSPQYGQYDGQQQYGYGQYGGSGQQYGQYGYGGWPYQPLTVQRDYAGWGARVCGYLIDGLVTIPGIILYAIGVGVFLSGMQTEYDPYSGTTIATGGGNPAGLALILLGFIVTVGIQIWNRWIRGGRTGQTIGRKAMGITLVGEETGQPIGAGMAFVRDIAHLLDSLLLDLGWLWPLWDDRKQTLADKVMKTVVVRTPK